MIRPNFVYKNLPVEKGMDLELAYLVKLKSGRLEAFDWIYQKYHNAVYGNIMKKVGSRDAAYDILQEVFLSLWENRNDLRTDISIGGWLFVVSFNKSISYLRVKVKEKIELIGDMSIYDVITNENDSDREIYEKQLSLLQEAISTLSPRKLQIFNLYRFEGRSIAEVSNLLGLSPETVKDNLKKSNKVIREYIAIHYRDVLGAGIILMLLS